MKISNFIDNNGGEGTKYASANRIVTPDINVSFGNNGINSITDKVSEIMYNFNKTYAVPSALSSATMNKLNQTVGIYDNPGDSVLNSWRRSTSNYNRFKLPQVNDALQKGFGHVFFVKPNCNIFKSTVSRELTASLQNRSVFNYVNKNTPSILSELTTDVGSTDFMLSLSNKCNSLSLNEESIEDNTYGKNFSGYKIAYGKNNVESKTASSLTIGFDDDRFLHVYQLHKLWIEYISGVYRGTIAPRNEDVINKTLDYAGAVYYIVTAEDGETIIYWSKYYGIFPTNIPISHLSWTKGNIIKDPNFDVTYKYSFKEDFNPLTLTEFNKNARIGNVGSLVYEPTYDSTLGHSGKTWVKRPYIQMEDDVRGNSQSHTYKLKYTMN